MFNPSRADVRRFFFDAWGKYRSQVPLEGLERTAVEIMLLHPEFHPLLDDRERNIDREYVPEDGLVNPFLHLSLHIAIAEQLSIDQPRGIAAAYRELSAEKSEHDALHVLLECLGETVWRAQRDRAAPDESAYLECIRRASGRIVSG
jgi:Domain of unknown function (DUF1841)